MTNNSLNFPNWQSRLLLGRAARAQSIFEADLPWLIKLFIVNYERFILNIDISEISAERPIFLLGLPRSGTTMLQDLLCSHPDVAYFTNTMNRFPECFCGVEDIRRKLNLNFTSERYLKDSVEVTATSPSDALNFWARWFKFNPFSLDYRWIDPDNISPVQQYHIKQAIQKAIWCFGKPWRRFFCKLLAPLPNLELVQRIFPDAYYIHIIRDARMTANSMLKLCQHEIEQQDRYIRKTRNSSHAPYFIPYPRFPRLKEYVQTFGIQDIRTTAHLWNDAINYIDSVKANFLNYHEVRFEDIVANPDREISRLFQFCDLPPVPRLHEDFWLKVKNIGIVRHINKYQGFESVEQICDVNLKKYGYI